MIKHCTYLSLKVSNSIIELNKQASNKIRTVKIAIIGLNPVINCVNNTFALNIKKKYTLRFESLFRPSKTNRKIMIKTMTCPSTVVYSKK